MIVKFFDRGEGRSGGLDYLLSPTNHAGHRRPVQPQVVSGDFQLTQKIVDSSPFRRKYTSGVLRFTEADLSATEKREIIESFENALFPELEKDRVNSLWVEHRDHNQLELHFIFPNLDLATGKRLQPYFHRVDQYRIDAWKNLINHEHRLTDPCDPRRRRPAAPPGHKLPAGKKEIHATLTEHLLVLIRAGQIHDRQGVIQAIEAYGCQVARQGKQFLSITDPAGGRNIRLKGEIYSQDFDSANLQSLEAAARDYEAAAEERYQKTKGLFEKALLRRRDFLQKNHPPIPTTGVDVEALLDRLGHRKEWRKNSKEQRNFYCLYQKNVDQRLVDGWKMFRDRQDPDRIVHWHPQTRARMIDTGDRISLHGSADDAVIRRMIEVGCAKGWVLEDIRFFGHEGFRRRADEIRRLIIAEREQAAQASTAREAELAEKEAALAGSLAAAETVEADTSTTIVPATSKKVDVRRWWADQKQAFMRPPAGMPHKAAENRTRLYKRFRYIDNPASPRLRQEAAEAHPVLGPRLAKIRTVIKGLRRQSDSVDLQTRDLRERFEGLSPLNPRRWRLKYELARLTGTKEVIDGQWKEQRVDEQRVIDRCQPRDIETYRRSRELERAQSALAQLQEEAREPESAGNNQPEHQQRQRAMPVHDKVSRPSC